MADRYEEQKRQGKQAAKQLRKRQLGADTSRRGRRGVNEPERIVAQDRQGIARTGPDERKTMLRPDGTFKPAETDLYAQRTGTLTDAQLATRYMRFGLEETMKWRSPTNGHIPNTTRERAMELDRVVTEILRLQPSLQTNPIALMTIATEPFVDDRLRGMSRADTWLQMREEVLTLASMPDEHERLRWDDLPPPRQAALREAGYLPPEEREMRTGGIGNIIPGWGPLGTAGEYLGVDALYDVTQGELSTMGGKTFEALNDATNVVNTSYRVLSRGATQDFRGASSWNHWKEEWDRAWDGERYFHIQNQNAAMEQAQGDEAIYNLYVRLASGETVEEIAEDYAELGTVEYGDAYQDLMAFQANERTQAGVLALTRGKVSFGRDAAKQFLRADPEEDETLYNLSSGGFDLFWTLSTDPTLLAGRAYKGARFAKRGITVVRKLDEVPSESQLRQVRRVFELTGGADGKVVSETVAAKRGGRAVADVTKRDYWTSLPKLGIDKRQQYMVALADHAHAFRMGDDAALFSWAKAKPGARNMMQTFLNYLDKVDPLGPNGLPRTAANYETVQKFMRLAPDTEGKNLLDDVVHFTQDESGLYSLMSGQWTSTRWDRQLMPTLSRAGAYGIQAKLNLLKPIDWLIDQGVEIQKARLGVDDFDNTASVMAGLAEDFQGAAILTLEDELHALRRKLNALGVDGATVQRQMELKVMEVAGVTLREGELPSHAIMRTIHSANEFDDLVVGGVSIDQGLRTRQVYQAYLNEWLGPEVGAEWFDTAFRRYNQALGIGLEQGDVFDRVMTLDQAIMDATKAGTDRGVARARRTYEKSLRNAGQSDEGIEEAVQSFDLLVGEARASTALDPAAAAADFSHRIKELTVLPLSRLAMVGTRFIEGVPAEPVLALNALSTPQVLEQFLSFNIRGRKAAELYSQFFRAGEGGRRAVVRNIYTEMFGRMGILNDPEHAAFVDEWMRAGTQRYARHDLFPSPQGMVHVGFLPDSHYASHVALPSYREIHANMKRSRLLNLFWGYGHKRIGVNSELATSFMNAWRASVVLRPAMIPRGGGEEFGNQVMRYGFGYGLRQGVVARFHRIPKELRGRSGLAHALAQEDAVGAFGKAWIGSKHYMQAMGNALLDSIEPATRAAMGPEVQHAYTMNKLSPTARKGFENVSGVNAGTVPVAAIGPITHDLHGAPFSIQIIDSHTGEAVQLNLRPAGEWTSHTARSEFYNAHLGHKWRTYTTDEWGRAGIAAFQTYVPPEKMSRIGSVLRDRLDQSLLPNVALERHALLPPSQKIRTPIPTRAAGDDIDHVVHARATFARLDGRDTQDFHRWLDDNTDLAQADSLDDVISPEGVQTIAEGFGWSLRETPERFEELVATLGWDDFNALLVNGPAPYARPMGHLDRLTEPGSVYRGTTITDDPELLFHRGSTFDEVAGTIDARGHSGPGVYVTDSGHYAESYISGLDVRSRPAVTRLRWRQGGQPKLIPYQDLELAPTMATYMDDMLDDLIGQATQRDVGRVLVEVRNRNLTTLEAQQVVDDMDFPPDLAESLMNVIRDGVPSPGYGAGIDEGLSADTVQDVLYRRRGEWDSLLDKLDEFGLLELDGDEAELYNLAYRRHVIDPFTADGYRGIADHQPYMGDELGTDLVTSAAYWHPGDLEVVEEIPWGESIANAVLEERARASRLNLSLAVEDEEAAKELMRVNLREMGWRPDRQYKRARMDRTSANGQGSPKGTIRVQVPIVPQVTARGMIDEISKRGGSGMALTGEELMTSGAVDVAGVGGQLDRATMLARIGDPDTRAFIDRTLDRIEAMGDDVGDVSMHLASVDPETSKIMLDRIRGGIKATGVSDELANAVHLGYIDLSLQQWNDLAHTNLPAVPSTPGAVTRTEGQVAAELAGLPEDARAAMELEALRFDGLTPQDPGVYGAPIRFINDNTVLENAFSLPFDDVRWQAIDLDDTDRAWAMRELGRSRAKQGHAQTVAPRSDQDLIQQLRQLQAEGVPGALEDVPAHFAPYLAEAKPGFSPTTKWQALDGTSGYEGMDDMIETLIGDVMDSFRGQDGNVIHAVTRPVANGDFTSARHFKERDVGSLPEVVMGPTLKVDELPRGRRARAKAAAGEATGTVVDAGMNIIGKGISWMSRHPIWRESFASSYTDARQVFRAFMVDSGNRARAASALDGKIDDIADTLMEHTAMWQDSGAGFKLDDHTTLSILAEEGHFVPSEPLIRWTDNGKDLVPVNRLEFTDDEKAILRWWHQEDEAGQTAVRAAEARATAQTIPYIDDHRVRSQFAETIRNIVPFWFAEEQFYKRWLRTFAHSPESLRRLTLTHQAMNSSGFIQENEFGEEVFIYPGADKAANALATVMNLLPTDSKWTLPVSVAMQGQLQYAAPGFDRIGVPSAGPLVAVPLRLLRSIQPELAMPMEEKLLGERGVGRSLPEQVLPSAIYRLFNFATASDEDMTSMTIGAMVMIEANHPEFAPDADATPEEVDVYFERVRNHARIMMFSKALLGTTLPASPQFDYDPENLSQEFRGYLAAGVPIEEAAADFLADHPDATAYTIFNTETPSKAPTDPTEAVYQELLTNDDFYEGNRAASWLLPAGEPTDPFDRQAWYELLANKVRVRKSDMEFYQDLKFAEAADLYFESKEEVENAKLTARTSAERERINEVWREWKDEYFATHRIFAQGLQNPESQNRRQDVLANIGAVLDHPDAPDVPQAPIIRELMVGYDQLQVKLREYGGETSREERMRKAMRYDYMTWADEYSRAHPTALLYFRRILLPEVDTTGGYAAELEDQEAGPGGGR